MSVLPNPNFEGIEIAGRTVEKMLHGDGQFPALQDKLRVGKEFKNFKVDLKKFNFCYFLYLTYFIFEKAQYLFMKNFN